VRFSALVTAAIMALSASANAVEPIAPHRFSDEEAVPAYLTQVLRAPTSPLLPKPFPLAPIGVMTLERSPEMMVPTIGFSFEFSAHPERLLREPRVSYRLLATAENLALVGYGFASYWIHKKDNAVDWELTWSAPSFREKLWTFEAVRLDTNTFETNAIWHPAAGVSTYLAARGSRLGVGESLAFAVASSAIWEFFAEYREKVSINDLLFTPLAGPTIGEPLHQMGLFFERGEDNLLTRLLSVGFSPFRFLNRYLLGWVPMRARTIDSLGFPSDIWHRFDLFAGVSTEIGQSGLRLSERYIGAQTEIIDLPTYDEPGVVTGSLRAGAITSMRFSGLLDDRGIHQSDFVSRAMLGGVYAQSIDRDDENGLSGYALFAGLSTAFNYATHTYDARADDRLGVVNALGGTFDATIYQGRLRARIGIEAYADFAAVNSMAIDDYLDRYGNDGLKTVLKKQQYYFALGTTIRPTVSVSYRGIELGGQVTQDFFESIEGLDRFQERIKYDVHLSDQRTMQRYWLSFALPGDGTKHARFELEQQARRGDMGDISASRQGLNLRGCLSVRF
jgi:hypothetical protein